MKPNTKCECGKGRVVFIAYPGSKPVRSCTWTLREYERKHGKTLNHIYAYYPEA